MTCPRSGSAGSESRLLPSRRPMGSGWKQSLCLLQHREQGEGGRRQPGFCSQGWESSFAREGNGIGICSGEKIPHPKPSWLFQSLASAMAENHNHIELVLGSDRSHGHSPRLLPHSFAGAWQGCGGCWDAQGPSQPGDCSAMSPGLRRGCPPARAAIRWSPEVAEGSRCSEQDCSSI